MRINKEKTCAVVIDVQERLFPHIHDHYALELKIVTLLNGLRELDVPVLVTQQYTKGLGPTIAAITETLNDFTHIEKTSFSCWGERHFEEALETMGKNCVILMGVETHVCVQQTALDLLAHNYTPVIIADAVSSRSALDRQVALDRMRQAGAIITTVESILFELCKVAGTPAFKAISKLVK